MHRRFCWCLYLIGCKLVTSVGKKAGQEIYSHQMQRKLRMGNFFELDGFL